MPRVNTIRTNTKVFQAALEGFQTEVLNVLKRYNAEETTALFVPKMETRWVWPNHFTLNTPAGSLRVILSPPYTIFQCFDKPEIARIATHCNEHSGKWNFHFSTKDIRYDALGAAREWSLQIERLMSIPYGWEPFAVRYKRWQESQRPQSGHKLTPGVTLVERVIN